MLRYVTWRERLSITVYSGTQSKGAKVVRVSVICDAPLAQLQTDDR
jgi:hypothetical protein